MYNTYMLKNKFISFILFLIITYSASFIGGMATISFKEPWYSQLVKSNFNPPDWVFAPVWSTLYLMMTLAIWFYWHSKNREMNTIYIYFIHIVFNTTWSIVFFGLHQILLALFVLSSTNQRLGFYVLKEWFLHNRLLHNRLLHALLSVLHLLTLILGNTSQDTKGTLWLTR